MASPINQTTWSLGPFWDHKCCESLLVFSYVGQRERRGSEPAPRRDYVVDKARWRCEVAREFRLDPTFARAPPDPGYADGGLPDQSRRPTDPLRATASPSALRGIQ